jgi:phosphoenolpyruvate carboxykinase (GTP)
MAMLPFMGYNAGDYFQHWLDMGEKISNKPKIFNVNWFRTNDQGKFAWPGYGDNFRVLKWIVDRCQGKVDAVKTPIGFIPNPEDIDVEGLDNFTAADVADLLTIERDVWKTEVEGIEEFFKKFDRLPKEMNDELAALKERFDF